MFIKNLFSFLFYVAADFGEGESTETTDGQQENIEDIEDIEDQELTSFLIDGEEYDVETIKEWKQGHLRQSDYTRKTQELAQMKKEFESRKKEVEDAIEVYKFLQANPKLTEELYEKSLELGEQVPKIKTEQATDPRIEKALYEFELQKIESQLKDIKKDNPNVNDVELLNLANDKGVDLETAYILWKGQNVDALLKKNEEELINKLKNNTSITSTLINSIDNKAAKGLGLSNSEVVAAKELGMTIEEYAKWKNYNPNK